MIIAICDDNAVFLKQLNAQIREYPGVEKTLLYSNYEVLLADIRSFLSPDLVIMDMEWNRSDGKEGQRHSSRENGMVLAEQLLQYSPRTQILYITGYLDHFAQRVFMHKANVVGLLRKPLDASLLKMYMDRVWRVLEDEREKEKYLVVKKQRDTINILYDDIRYIECTNHVIHIVTDKMRLELSRSLESLEPELTDNFVRCHKSYMVNLSHVENVTRSGIQMQEKEEMIPVGRNYYGETRRRFMVKLADSL